VQKADFRNQGSILMGQLLSQNSNLELWLGLVGDLFSSSCLSSPVVA